MQVLNNVASQNGYDGPPPYPPGVSGSGLAQGKGCSLGPSPFTTGIQISVYNQPVAAQFLLYDEPAAGAQGGVSYGPEFVITPQAVAYPAPVAGIRLRSFVAGSPAQVIGQLWETSDGAFPQSPNPLTATISGGGQVTNPSGFLNFFYGSIASIGQSQGLDINPFFADGSNTGGLAATPGFADILFGANLLTNFVAYTTFMSQVHGVATQLADSGFLTGTQASFDFTSLPASSAQLNPAPPPVQPGSLGLAYMSLLVAWYGRTTGAVTVGEMGLQVNGDSGADYQDYSIQATNSPIAISLIESGGNTSVAAGAIAGSTATANYPGGGLILIPGYAGTSFFKPMVFLSYGQGAAGGTNPVVNFGGGVWLNTAAINRVTLTPRTGSWATGSRAVVYGI